ncbi:MAG: hypothetical protein SGI77_21820 [Pirellulaceae bacterium]|nr:hypothetical protein [Pirellulaceae bacterium]
MNHWQKLGLPVALGICAAYLNWNSVTSKLEPRDYVAAKADVKPGEKLTRESFTRVSISHTSQVGLENTLVPWSQVDAITIRYAQRNIPAKSPLTQFDIFDGNTGVVKTGERATTVTLKSTEFTASFVFVNDWVNVSDQFGLELMRCRIISITRGDKETSVCMAGEKIKVRKFELGRNSESRFQINAFEHTADQTLNGKRS